MIKFLEKMLESNKEEQLSSANGKDSMAAVAAALIQSGEYATTRDIATLLDCGSKRANDVLRCLDAGKRYETLSLHNPRKIKVLKILDKSARQSLRKRSSSLQEAIAVEILKSGRSWSRSDIRAAIPSSKIKSSLDVASGVFSGILNADKYETKLIVCSKYDRLSVYSISCQLT